MKMWRLTALFLVVGFIAAACSSWSGPAEVRLKDGTVLSCTKGLTFNVKYIICSQDDGNNGNIEVPWGLVAGYATK